MDRETMHYLKSIQTNHSYDKTVTKETVSFMSTSVDPLNIHTSPPSTPPEPPAAQHR